MLARETPRGRREPQTDYAREESGSDDLADFGGGSRTAPLENAKAHRDRLRLLR